MERFFNTEGLCEPEKHYMVPLDDRLKLIRRRFIERGSYFVINRGRQYGKTTMLRALADCLKSDYMVISLDFQEIGTAEFKDEGTFSRAFAALVCEKNAKQLSCMELLRPLEDLLKGEKEQTLRVLFSILSDICGKSEKPIVLMIDEVDSASNNQVFLDFLALLRGYYLNRSNTPTFHSVILAGVYDIKNLKQKIRPDDEHKYNSPWNIAAKFDVAMEFSTEQIASMLREYENDHSTGMDVCAVAEEIYAYTSGYPYLVSAICRIIDEELMHQDEEVQKPWTCEMVRVAVKSLLGEKIPLLESMVKQLNEYPELRNMLYALLFQGEEVSYNAYNHAIGLAAMFGYVREKDGMTAVANRIFEMHLYNYFLSEEELESKSFREGRNQKSLFVQNHRLNMELVLEKFVTHFSEIYGEQDEKFIESYGRKFFLLYLKPIINGTGNYYIESQTRDSKRTDVIVDYMGEQFVVEMKIWHGEEYNQRGEEQLADYLNYYHKDKGYMISFNFNKKKEIGVRKVEIGNKVIVEAVV